jgi:hypothetical protein
MSNLSRLKIFSLVFLSLLLIVTAGNAATIERVASNPHMTSASTPDEVLSSVLGEWALVKGIQGEALVDALSFSSDSHKHAVKTMDGYVRCTIYSPINGYLRISDIQNYMPEMNTRNYAVLWKVRPSETSEWFQFSEEIAGGRFEVNIPNRLNHEFISHIGNKRIEPADDANNALAFQSNQWYYVLITFNHAYTYRYVMWQAANPLEYMDQQYDFSPYFADSNPSFDKLTTAEISFSTSVNEDWMDVESVQLYKYDEMPSYDTADATQVGTAASGTTDTDTGTAEEAQTGDTAAGMAEEAQTGDTVAGTAEEAQTGDTAASAAADTIMEGVAVTFIPQALQPIEEKPFRLPLDIDRSGEYTELPIVQPHIGETASRQEIAASVLVSPREVVKLQNKALANTINLHATDAAFRTKVNTENGVVRALIQTESGGQGEALDIWGKLYFDKISQALDEAGGIREGAASAVAVKFRYTGINSGMSLFLENKFLSVNAGLGCD